MMPDSRIWRILLVVIFLAAAQQLGAIPAEAAPRQGNPVVVIIVDVPFIQRESLAGKALFAQRDKYQQSFQSEFNASRQQMQVADSDLLRQKSSLAPDVYDQKVKALEAQVMAFQRKTQVAVRALEKSTETAISELMNQILTVTGEIANELGANLVIPKQQVVLHEPSMDVTQLVIDRLNARVPSINFPLPQADEQAAPSAAAKPKGK